MPRETRRVPSRGEAGAAGPMPYHRNLLSSFGPFHQPRGLLGWLWDPLHKDNGIHRTSIIVTHHVLRGFSSQPSIMHLRPTGLSFSFKRLIPWMTKLISRQGLKGETKQRCLAFKNLIYEMPESSWVLLYSGFLPMPPKVLRGRTEHTKHLKANTMRCSNTTRYLFYPVRVKAVIVGCRSQQSHMQYPQ